jgi:hypothetical protein
MSRSSRDRIPSDRVPSDRVPTGRSSADRTPPPPPRRTTTVRGTSSYNRPRAVQPKRDPFPYIMGGIIGAMVVGLVLVIFLLTSNNNNTNTVNVPNSNPTSAINPNVVGITPPAVGTAAGEVAPTAIGGDPPRMELKDFKASYDDPAKRPIILDVRAADVYASGHIKGAVSFPEADLTARAIELPKDKLIVAYCQ